MVEVKSSDVEKGLNELLDKVREVYGGEGKVKVKRKNKNNVYSFKYGGPERGLGEETGGKRNGLIERRDDFWSSKGEKKGREGDMLYKEQELGI